MIPQSNPLAGYQERQAELDAALLQVMQSGWYILGREVEEFEREFAEFTDRRQGVGTASGTDAIELALRACGVGAGDLVFTVSHTAVATVVGIERSGAEVAVVDIDPETYTMSPTCLEETIEAAAQQGHRAAAIVPVHLYGHPADMPELLKIARKHQLVVVEDCAQAHGARLDGKLVGTWGDAAVFSFYPTKNLGAFGDGGLVATDDDAIAERARELRQYGWRERFISAETGMNTRLDEIQAALLRVRLRHLDNDNQRRRQIAGRYAAGLAESEVQLPSVRPGAEHVYHQFVVQTERREELREFLKSRGVGTALHYPCPVHQQPAYADRLFGCERLPVTEAIRPRILSLPMFPQLSDTEVATVVEAIQQWPRN